MPGSNDSAERPERQVYICTTVYNLFIALLLNMANRRPGRQSAAILLDGLSGHPDCPPFTELVHRIGSASLFDHVVPFDSSQLERDALRRAAGPLRWAFNRPGVILERARTSNPHLRDMTEFIRSAEINLFFYNQRLDYFLLEFAEKKFRVYEDGFGTYRWNPTWKDKLRSMLLRVPERKGADRRIEAIFVQHPDRISRRLAHKTHPFSLEALSASLTPDQVSNMFKVFLDDATQLDALSEHRPRSIILTQDLRRTRLIREEADQVKFYRAVWQDLIDPSHQVVIKPHPADKIDYSAHFPQAIVLPRAFPIELLNFLGTSLFEAGYTVSSTSLENMTAVRRRIYLGLDAIRRVLANRPIEPDPDPEHIIRQAILRQ